MRTFYFLSNVPAMPPGTYARFTHTPPVPFIFEFFRFHPSAVLSGLTLERFSVGVNSIISDAMPLELFRPVRPAMPVRPELPPNATARDSEIAEQDFIDRCDAAIGHALDANRFHVVVAPGIVIDINIANTSDTPSNPFTLALFGRAH